MQKIFLAQSFAELSDRYKMRSSTITPSCNRSFRVPGNLKGGLFGTCVRKMFQATVLAKTDRIHFYHNQEATKLFEKVLLFYMLQTGLVFQKVMWRTHLSGLLNKYS